MKYKTIFLLVFFLLNTAIVFACAFCMQETIYKDYQKHLCPAMECHQNDVLLRNKGEHQIKIENEFYCSLQNSYCYKLANDLVINAKIFPLKGKVYFKISCLSFRVFTNRISEPFIKLIIQKCGTTNSWAWLLERDIRLNINSLQI